MAAVLTMHGIGDQCEEGTGWNEISDGLRAVGFAAHLWCELHLGEAQVYQERGIAWRKVQEREFGQSSLAACVALRAWRLDRML
jgi:hypothetical protein